MQSLISTLDKSVNFVLDNGQEARYVRREDDYFIVYLSSHNGCNKACRFCHLTQTNQTDFVEATMDDFVIQATLVLNHYRDMVKTGQEPAASRIHFNWMARGEPLDNSVVITQWKDVVQKLTSQAYQVGITSLSFNLSTIVPATYLGDFTFSGDVQPHIYYSLYSLEKEFRRRWLPKAKEPLSVLADLKAWQSRTNGNLTLHWAMIEGENDDSHTVDRIASAVTEIGLTAKFNLVRYNPYSSSQGNEPEENVLAQRFAQIVPVMIAPGSRIVPRVGFDVKASCGMFVESTSNNKVKKIPKEL
jgi:23S rRNA (adenine2503-C2)-methyltransferase